MSENPDRGERPSRVTRYPTRRSRHGPGTASAAKRRGRRNFGRLEMLRRALQSAGTREQWPGQSSAHVHRAIPVSGDSFSGPSCVRGRRDILMDRVQRRCETSKASKTESASVCTSSSRTPTRFGAECPPSMAPSMELSVSGRPSVCQRPISQRVGGLSAHVPEIPITANQHTRAACKHE